MIDIHKVLPGNKRIQANVGFRAWYQHNQAVHGDNGGWLISDAGKGIRQNTQRECAYETTYALRQIVRRQCCAAVGQQGRSQRPWNVFGTGFKYCHQAKTQHNDRQPGRPVGQ